MVSRPSYLFSLDLLIVSLSLSLSISLLGITLMSADEADSLQEASMELLNDEDLVVEFLDLKDEGKFPKTRKRIQDLIAVQQY